MKRRLLIIGGIVLLAFLIIGLKINSDRHDLSEAFHTEHSLRDSSFVLLNEQVSPSERFICYEYQFDNGGFGYSRVFWSVIENDPEQTKLEKGLLPDGYKAIEWTINDELVIEKWDPYYFKDKEVLLNSGDEFNGVKLKLKK
jgi:hypothetical protein